ncbi:hypothetical protein BASA62_004948 [Batrachochytrium salamandrivorans]|nr:hypothetical protein BASA62_004948 [Batrachochytrium salamandrivorans]
MPQLLWQPPTASTNTMLLLRRRELVPNIPGSLSRLPLIWASRSYATIQASQHTTIGSHTARTGCSWIDIAQSDSRFLISARTDLSISIYDLDDFTPQFNGMRSVSRVAAISSGLVHSSKITGVCWFPRDTGLFTTSSLDRSIKVWDSASLEVAFIFRLEDSVITHALSPIASTHALIAAGTDASHIRLCDMKSGALTHSLTGHRGPAASLQWSPVHEFLLVSGGVDGTIRFWDIRKANSCVWKANHSKNDFGERKSTYNYNPQVNGLAFTSDGQSIASTSHDEHIYLWSIFSGDRRQINYGPHLRNRISAPLKMAITPLDSTLNPLLIYPSDNKHVLIYDLWSGALVKRLSVHLGRVSCVAIRSDTQQIVSSGVDDPIILWESQHGRGGDDLLSLENAGNADHLCDTWSDTESV